MTCFRQIRSAFWSASSCPAKVDQLLWRVGPAQSGAGRWFSAVELHAPCVCARRTAATLPEPVLCVCPAGWARRLTGRSPCFNTASHCRRPSGRRRMPASIIRRSCPRSCPSLVPCRSRACLVRERGEFKRAQSVDALGCSAGARADSSVEDMRVRRGLGAPPHRALALLQQSQPLHVSVQQHAS